MTDYQHCTDIKQSERLLKLGLKKETSDMTIHIKEDGNWYYTAEPFCEWEEDMLNYPSLDSTERCIPAWGLHNLILMAYNKGIGLVVTNNTYNMIISYIEKRINMGVFNKDFLEEKYD